MSTDRQFKRNHKKAIFGGVCSGIARYFNFSKFWVRALFIVGIFIWPAILLVYLVLYFCMESDKHKDTFGANHRNTYRDKVSRHFKNVDYSKELRKNSTRGRIAGVCAGIADYFEINTLIVRLAFLISLIFGPLPVIVYILAAFIMDGEESQVNAYHKRYHQKKKANRRHFKDSHFEHEYSNDESQNQRSHHKRDESGEEQQWQNVSDAKRSIKTVSEQFAQMETKLRRVEATITSKRFRLLSELNRMS